MFSQLGDKLQDVFKDLRGHGPISEENVNDALREVRLALLEADVDFQVAKDFIARVKEKALGEDVLRSVTPGQQIVKIFHDELTSLLGGDAAPLNLDKPARILMVGLNGAGKTTSSAKLAALAEKAGPRAASDRLRFAASGRDRAAGHPGRPGRRPGFHAAARGKGRDRSAKAALAWAEGQTGNVQIFDTAGRQEIDEPLVQELKQLKEFLQPQEVLLVADAATGQQAVSVANHFHEALGLTGIILTKLDGDARGGAALSMREVTQRPIKFAGVGRKAGPVRALSSRTAWPGASSAWATSSAWSRRPPRPSTRRTPLAWRRSCGRRLRPQRLPAPVQDDANDGPPGKYPWHVARDG